MKRQNENDNDLRVKVPKRPRASFDSGQGSSNEVKYKSASSQYAYKRSKSEARVQLMQLFEDLRRSSCPPHERSRIIDKLTVLLTDRLDEGIRFHDVSRIVQFMLKRGTAEQKDVIAKEILGNISSIAKNKHSRHVIKAAFRHCSSTVRRQLIKELTMNTVSLLKCRNSGFLLQEVYTKYAGAEEKLNMRHRIYGKLFSTLASSYNDLQSLANNDRSLAEHVCSETERNLHKLLKNNWCLKFEMVSSVLRDYLTICTQKQRETIYQKLKFSIIDLIGTDQGTHIALKILWTSSTKEKKAIVKQIKEEFINLSLTKSGSFFVLSLFDSVDDTVLMQKAIITKINKHLKELIKDKYGRRIIVYIFEHRDATSFFSSEELITLKEADITTDTKKSSQQRLSEIRNYCVSFILKSIQDHPKLWIMNGPANIIAASVFRSVLDPELNQQIHQVYGTISKLLTVPDKKICEGSESIELIEYQSVHYFMKRLIKDDRARHTKNLVTFSSCLIAELNEDIVIHWLKFNRGCFCLLWLMETGIDSIEKSVGKYLQMKKAREFLFQQTSMGANLLQKKVLTFFNQKAFFTI